MAYETDNLFVVRVQICLSGYWHAEPEEGGKTTFTKGAWAHPQMAPNQETLSECGKGKVAFKPKRGDAILFFDRQV